MSKYLNGILISNSALSVGDHYIGLSGCLNFTESFVFVSQVYLIYKWMVLDQLDQSSV